MNRELVRTSKFLSLVLRHRPESIGLVLDENGWASVSELLKLSAQQGRKISRALLERVVSENEKQRFTFNTDHSRIRANQGHSISVDLELKPTNPPDQLFHGTATRYLDSIRASGLTKQNRQHVHLSQDVDTASRVGWRHGKVVVLVIESGKMNQNGHQFFLSENGVWLTDVVPVEFIQFPEDDGA